MGGVKPVSGRGWKKKLYRHRKSSSRQTNYFFADLIYPQFLPRPFFRFYLSRFSSPSTTHFYPLLHRKSIRDFFGPRADQPCSRLTRVNIVGDSGEAPGLIRQIRKASRNKCLPRRYRWSGTRLVDTVPPLSWDPILNMARRRRVESSRV